MIFISFVERSISAMWRYVTSQPERNVVYLYKDDDYFLSRIVWYTMSWKPRRPNKIGLKTMRVSLSKSWLQ
jgi:hypothetical protein